jgi:PAS domain S-box-containing protein
MAPEQTGRMNRSIDSRSDLYSLGVSFYQMLTGSLPFTASDPMEWVHCHIARKPIPPAERSKNVPVAISQIVMTLLAKTAEERYQTAVGVESDLRRCLVEWERQERIDLFALRDHDARDRLLIPEKIYGRAREVDALIECFDRVVTSGQPELVLVRGYSGVGKSSVVNELHRALVASRGLFASGKFDQYKRDIPYSTLVQALRSLVRPLLGKSDAELNSWRDDFMKALDPNGQLMVDLVPELKLIIGEQAPLPDLPQQQAQARFQLVFRRFISVFARPEHPLALFLDDLQWLDSATLDLLGDLLTRSEAAPSDLQHLILIGAYRDNEVDAAHPLTRKLQAIRNAGTRIEEITLVSLGREHLKQLIADALRCEPPRAAPIAQLVHEKTGGNPLFAVQFISSLAEEGLLRFEPDAAGWSWDLERIRARGYTDNVLDLMVGKLTRLRPETQKAMQQLACIGNTAAITTLSIAFGTSEDQVHADLSEAVRLELVERLKGSYRFVHDRVQEAAYSLIPKDARASVHLHIGRLLATHTPLEEREETIFEIVSQLSRGAVLITEQDERERVAELNLIAGKRAKASTAYVSACAYLGSGMILLGTEGWTGRYELALDLWFERAECEYLSGNFDAAEPLISELLARAASKIDRAAAYRLEIDIHVMKSESPKAVESALECLRLFGIEMSPHPAREQVEVEYEKVWSSLGTRSIESLIDLPLMTDPEMKAAMQVLSVLFAPALTTDINLTYLHVCHMVNVTLKYGTTGASTPAYAFFGIILRTGFSRYADSYRFGRLACDLVEKHNLLAYKAKTYISMEMIALWTQPLQAAIDYNETAFRAAVETGDLHVAGYSRSHTVTDFLLRGDHLDDVWQESERGLDFARRAKFHDVVDAIVSQQRFIENMRGRTAHFSTFSDATFDEDRFEAQLTEDRTATTISRYWMYWIIKIQARFLSGDYATALVAARKAKALIWVAYSHIRLFDYYYYTALAITAAYRTLPPDEQAQWREILVEHLNQLREWAESCPATFRDKHALVAAETARLDGRELDAERLYEEAVRSARTNGFVQNEALAYELAARFYATRGFDEFARLYLRHARERYLRWGALGKVRQLEEWHPHLGEHASASGPTSTIGAQVETVGTLVDVTERRRAEQRLLVQYRVTRILAEAATVEEATPKILQAMCECLGWDRGSLWRIDREAGVLRHAELWHAPSFVAPQFDAATRMSTFRRGSGILGRVWASRAPIYIPDIAQDPEVPHRDAAAREGLHAAFAFPILLGSEVLGVMGFLSRNVWRPDQNLLDMMATLGSQIGQFAKRTAAVDELQLRVSMLQNIPVAAWSVMPDGTPDIVNQLWYEYTGQTPEYVNSHPEAWMATLHPEDRDRASRSYWDGIHSGRGFTMEARFLRARDGTYRWHLNRAVPVRDAEGNLLRLVGTSTDVHDWRQAQEALRNTQTEFAHMTRVMTMGELTASIAHEVNQPLGAIVTSAAAGTRWLATKPPQMDKARRALERIANDGKRAAEVIRRIRALMKRQAPRKEWLDINETILEVIALAQYQLRRNAILLETRLGHRLPPVRGDRVQLQQVLLNLIINAIEAMSGIKERPRKLTIVSASDGPDTVSVEVRDAGTGLDPEHAPHLFEPFYTTKAEGLGIGLSISLSIVEAHGGRLSATANAPHGTVFLFSLPVNETAP